MAANFHQRIVTRPCKGKGTDHPTKDREDPEGEYRYSRTLPTSALDGVDGQRHAPSDLPPPLSGKDPVHIV